MGAPLRLCLSAMQRVYWDTGSMGADVILGTQKLEIRPEGRTYAAGTVHASAAPVLPSSRGTGPEYDNSTTVVVQQ